MGDAGNEVARRDIPPVLLRRRWLIALVLLLVVIAGFFDRISIAVLFTDAGFRSAMGVGFNPARLGLLMTGFLFAYGISGLVLGFLGDRFGPRYGLAVAGTIWGAVMGFMGTASGFVPMLLSRLVLGIAEGPQFSFLNKAVQQWFPPREQARANSLWLMGSPLGSAIGFPLTVALVAYHGWRASFFALSALNLLVIVPVVLLAMRGRPPLAVPASHAARAKAPGFAFLADWRFWLVVVFNSAALFYLWGLNSWLPSYLMRARHFNLRALGLFSSLPFILMFLGELAGGIVSDRLGRRAPVCLVGLLGAGLFVWASGHVESAPVAAVLIAVGAGFWGMALPPLFALAGDIVPHTHIAAAVGVFNGIGNLIGASSPLLMGWVIGVTGSFDAGMLVLVFSGLVGAAAMLPLLRRY